MVRTAPLLDVTVAARLTACTAAAGVLALAWIALAAPSARADEVAVLPIVAEGLLPSARDALEQDMRDAVASLGVTVQSAADTRAHLDEGSSAGLDCRLTDEECALRVGLIADVDAVLVTSVELIGERMLLRGAWLDVDGEPRRRIAGEIKMPAMDGGRLLKAAVRRLVTGKGEPTPLPVELATDPPDAALVVDGEPQKPVRGVLWLVPGPHDVRLTAPGREPLARTVVIQGDGTQPPLAFALPLAARTEEAPTLVYVGASVASVGALLAVLGGVAATLIENDLQAGSVPDAQYTDRQGLGVLALGAVGVGGALAAGGVVTALVGTP